MINKPGIYPAINSAATDTPPLAIEYTISALLGGISRPLVDAVAVTAALKPRSEEHTSELQSRGHLVCRLLLEKKKKSMNVYRIDIKEVSVKRSEVKGDVIE